MPPSADLNSTFNYVRNSVKVVINAYDRQDGLLRGGPQRPDHQGVRAGLPRPVHPVSKADTLIPGIVAHFRYPEDIFTVQTNMYGRYHLTDPAAFYTQAQAWTVSPDPAAGPCRAAARSPPTIVNNVVGHAAVPQLAPQYVLAHLPGSTQQTFMLLEPFVPVGPVDGAPEPDCLHDGIVGSAGLRDLPRLRVAARARPSTGPRSSPTPSGPTRHLVGADAAQPAGFQRRAGGGGRRAHRRHPAVRGADLRRIVRQPDPHPQGRGRGLQPQGLSEQQRLPRQRPVPDRQPGRHQAVLDLLQHPRGPERTAWSVGVHRWRHGGQPGSTTTTTTTDRSDDPPTTVPVTAPPGTTVASLLAQAQSSFNGRQRRPRGRRPGRLQADVQQAEAYVARLSSRWRRPAAPASSAAGAPAA